LSLADRLRALLRRISGVKDPEAPEKATGSDEGSGDGGLEEADLATLGSLSRCTACRACDVAFDAYDETARPVFHGPSELVTSYAWAIDDHGAAKRYVESLRRGNLEELERICPVAIPFVALADLVEKRGQALEPDERSAEDSRPRHDPG